MSSPLHLSVRRATRLDVDAMVDIALAAMPMDPQWDYRFPRRHQYPEDTRAFTRQRYQEFLDDERHWEVHIAESSDERGTPGATPVAFAIWVVANLHTPRNMDRQKPSTSAARARLDASQPRLRAWAAAMASSKSRLFDDVYGKNHLHLQILAVHPHYQRRRAGTVLCTWGIHAARMRRMAVSVFASPMGRCLYIRLGFQEVGEVLVQAEGESEYIKVAALSYEPPGLWKIPLLSSSESAQTQVGNASLTALIAVA